MPNNNQRLLVLIDGHALAYRMFFALPTDHFTTREGEPTNATYGFVRTLLDLINDDNPPDYLAVVWDAGMSFRDEAYPEYKGHREKMPDELDVQIERLKEVMSAFNIPNLILENYEADDIIGTVAKRVGEENQGVHTLIVTGDRDLLQLVDDNTTAQLPKFGGGTERYNRDGVIDKMGVPPEQVVDYKAMVGDTSDNIPGVAGVGDKTALKLLQQYPTVQAIYDDIENVTPTRARNALDKGKDDAFLSYKLALIQTDVPVDFDLDKCKIEGWDRDLILELFQTLEFRTLAEHVPGGPPKRQASIPAGQGQQLSMFGSVEMSEPREEFTETLIIRTEEELENLVKELESADGIAFDTETTGINQMEVALVGISLSVEPGIGYYIPVGHRVGDSPQLSLELVMDKLRPTMTNPGIPKYAHNIKYDAIIMARHGLWVEPLSFDTMLGEWLVHPSDSRGKLGLKSMAWRDLQLDMVEIEELIGSGRNQTTMDLVEVERAAPYAAADADVTLRLVELVSTRLDENEFAKRLFHEMEMPLVPVLARMEMNGILLDVELMKSLSGELGKTLEALTKDIYKIAGYEFNVNSTQQLSEVLFDKLQLPTDGIRKTRSGNYSTASDVLEALQEVDTTGIINALSEYRELEKLRGTYIDALPGMVSPHTGRIHTSFNQTGTVTGRISSSDPNLQNIPIRTEQGRRIRDAFIAPEGSQLLAADYSQVELRILAHVSGDEGLRKAFIEGLDIHASTAAAVFGVAPDKVSVNQRSLAKRVNFGLMYGMGPFRLARENNLTMDEAKEFIETYFARFPSVRGYFDGTRKQALEEGYVETLFGRRRYFNVLSGDGDMSQREIARAEREAINMPIQGTAADIIKIAMINLGRELLDRGMKTKMLLQVHDELVLEVPDEEVEEAASLVKQVMENAYKLDVPLKVDANVGRNWGALK